MLLQIWNGNDQISLINVFVEDIAHAFSQDWFNERLIDKLESLWGCSNVSPLHFHLGSPRQSVKIAAI